jgi:hypothetical protein
MNTTQRLMVVIGTLMILFRVTVLSQGKLDEIKALGFTVMPSKTSVLPFETLELVFTLRNETDRVRHVEADLRPLIFYIASRDELDNSETLEADGLRWHVCETGSWLLISPSSHAVTLGPGESLTRFKVLAYEKGEHKLPRPGRYLFKGMMDKLISKTVEIVVLEPQGVDMAAYEYLQRYPLHHYFSNWTRPSRDQVVVEEMEQFIARFRGSQYAEMAQLGLALMWMKGVDGKRDLERARSLLREAVKSSDEARAARAYYYLGQLAEEQGELIDAHQYYTGALSLKVDPYIEYVAKEAQAKIEPRLSPPKPRRPRR